MRHRTALLSLHDVARRGRQAERRAERDRLTSQHAFDHELLRLPVGRVRHLELVRREIERRRELAEPRDADRGGRASHIHDFRADPDALDDHGEPRGGVALHRLRSRGREPEH